MCWGQRANLDVVRCLAIRMRLRVDGVRHVSSSSVPSRQRNRFVASLNCQSSLDIVVSISRILPPLQFFLALWYIYESYCVKHSNG